MRASGIPAQYASGTLSYSQAQTLILSMFPASYQTVGYIPSGTQTSDPANDPQLQSETQSHYWFQYDTGGGMTNADPLMPGAAIGQTFTTSTGTFAAVPQSLEETTEIQLVAEIYNQAAAAFGLNPLQDTVVLDQTFDDSYLVGRPLSISNLVSQSGVGALFTEVTNTYTPYVHIGDEAYPDGSHDEITDGTPYQEVLTSFPLASQVLTGLSLNVTLSGPQGAPETYEHTILDRIGYAARQGLVPPDVSVDPSAPPALDTYDVTTVNVLAGLQHPSAPVRLGSELTSAQDQLQALTASTNGNIPLTTQVSNLLTQLATGYTRLQGESDLATSDALTAELATNYEILAYSERPRIVVTSIQQTLNAGSKNGSLSTAVDLLDDRIGAIAFPGQASNATFNFNVARGLTEDSVEYEVSAGGMNQGTPESAGAILAAAIQQGIPLAILTSDNIAQLAAFNLPAEVTARITQALQAGQIVLAPSAPVTIDGGQTAAWFETDPTTGYTIGVMQDGSHQGEEELAAANLAAMIVISTVLGVEIGFFDFYLRINKAPNPKRTKQITVTTAGTIVTGGSVFSKILPTNATTIVRAEVFGYAVAIAALGFLSGVDPALSGELSDLAVPLPSPPNVSSTTSPAGAGVSSGILAGQVAVPNLSVSNQVAASWRTSSTSQFQAQSMTAGSATVLGASGQVLGTGTVALAAPTVVSVSGSTDDSIDGQGSFSLFGPSESSLGVGGNWQSYTATVAGAVSIGVTVPAGALTLNGRALPGGTYKITTSSATISGSGTTSSPTFSGSASITTTDGTINIGPGNGTLSVGGKPLDPTDETTLDGYSGTITVSANGDGTDTVALSGNAGNALQVTASQPTLTTDQKTPVTFAANVLTSLADTYNLTASAPPGWTVTIDGSGNVTATPAPGLQSGTYPIQIIAQSQTDSNLEAQTTVEVTITPTQPGINFTVASDPLFTVPYNGAQLPTAFRATIQNLGPAADTYNLSFSNVPSGFSLVNSGTSVTVPAGAPGILGVYLVPNPGQPIPAPGTQLSFTVTATSATTSTITQTQTVTFTVPNIDAVTVTAGPAAVSTIPGAPVTDTLTITNVGNVDEDNITLTDTLPSGLTLTGFTPVSLAVGQSTTETITLTPDASTPLNTSLAATITATYGPSASPVTQTADLTVDVAAPGVPALENAAVAAGQLGNSGLANQLNNLATALTNLVGSPTSPVYLGQAQASLTSLISQVTGAPYIGPFASSLTSAQSALAAATTPAEIDAAITNLGTALGSLSQTLSDEALYGFTISLPSPIAEAVPGGPISYEIDITNKGNAAATYDLSVSGVPSGVTASFSVPSVTVQPGQTLTGTAAPTLTLTESGGTLVGFGFTVTATAEGASEINQGATGQVALRTQVIQVAGVTTTPPFTLAGGQVAVSATLQDVVNGPTDVEVSYTVTDANGNALFTSTPVSASLTTSSNSSTVDLGTLDTTGFANGSDTINVTVADASGHPIAGATGQAPLVIGLPVTATLSTSPTTLPSGSGVVTNTLQVDGQMTFPNPLTLESTASTPAPGTSVALYQNYAYESGTGGIDIFDVSDPASPRLVGTIDTSNIVQGTLGFNVVRVVGTNLFLATTTTHNATQFDLLDYSLADPASPQFVSDTPIDYTFLSDLLVNSTGTAAFVPTDGINYVAGTFITDSYGSFLSVDLSSPSSPKLADVLQNDRGAPQGGDYFQPGAALVNDQIAYVASTTATDGDTGGGQGQVLVVDIADPSKMSLVTSLTIPHTEQILEVGVQGNYALVVGSTGGLLNPLQNGITHFTGNVTLTLLDISNPSSPQVVGSTLVTSESPYVLGDSGAKIDVASLGNGEFLVSDVSLDPTAANPNPVVVLVDPSDPTDLAFSAIPVPSAVHGIAVSGDLMYATTAAGLSIYQVGPLVRDPVTISVQVPTGTSNNNSFSQTPTITTSGNVDTLTWTRYLAFGNTGLTFTWQSSVNNLPGGQTQDVTLGTTVDFNDQGTPGTITLPATTVAGAQIVSVTPAAQTARPGATATYDVRLYNPTSFPQGYGLAVQHLPGGWTYQMPGGANIPAGGYADVPLTITSGAGDALGTSTFTVFAGDANGASGTTTASLTLAGAPVLVPDTESHGIVATMTPAQATAGQGTSARYVIQLTNTGSEDDTFSLAVAGLPVGVTSTLGQTTIDVPPGASNFRDVTLTLTPAVGTATGSLPFTVTATSTTLSTVSGSADGTLDVTAGGVRVTLNSTSVAPGGILQATITNTGTAADTFDLALGGPAALVSSLGMSRVTLAPGASQVVPIATGAVDFAVQGDLDLTAMATSATDPAIRGASTSALAIPPTSGMTATFSPATQTLSAPGMATFLLTVQNTGNTEGSYSATIVGTTGRVTATLIGLDGSPTGSIPTFILPGLSTGVIEVQADLSAVGRGTVTVLVKSLTGAETASPVALAIAAPPGTTTPTSTPSTPGQTPSGPAQVTSPTSTAPGSTSAQGPRVEKVQRFGYHREPTTVVLTFDQALDPATASDVRDYRVVGLGGRTIRVRRAVYDPVAHTVTLHFARRLSVHHRYSLTVIGTGPDGISSSIHQRLDSQQADQPGGDDRIDLTWRQLVLGDVSRRFLERYGILPDHHRPGDESRSPRPIARGEVPGGPAPGPFSRPVPFAAHGSAGKSLRRARD